MLGLPNHLSCVLVVHATADEGYALNKALDSDFDVIMTTSITDAEELLTGYDFDVILSDYDLIEDTGKRFLQVCQEKQPAASRLLLSRTLNQDQMLQYIHGRHIDAWLPKPVDPKILLSAVHSASRASRLIRERSSLIGELAEANARIYSERQRLIEINTELRTLLAIATHDLREPLRSTRFFLDRCLEALDQKTEMPKEYLERVKSAHERMDGLLHNLREWLHLQSGEIDLRTVELQTVVAEAVDSLSRLISERHVVLKYPSTWSAVQGNAPLLRSVVENLLANAIRFSVDGPPHIELHCAQTERGTVRVAVTDHGIGIDPEYHSQIFGMFKRLESRKTFPGTGAGLAICQKIIQRHHGSLGVDSTRGNGATFWFEIPAAPS